MDREKIERAVRLMLEGMGEDPGRPGLLDTPARVARMYEEIFSGIGKNAINPKGWEQRPQINPQVL